MDRWKGDEIRVDGRQAGMTDGRMVEGCMIGRKKGWVGGRRDGWMDGRNA